MGFLKALYGFLGHPPVWISLVFLFVLLVAYLYVTRPRKGTEPEPGRRPRHAKPGPGPEKSPLADTTLLADPLSPSPSAQARRAPAPVPPVPVQPPGSAPVPLRAAVPALPDDAGLPGRPMPPEDGDDEKERRYRRQVAALVAAMPPQPPGPAEPLAPMQAREPSPAVRPRRPWTPAMTGAGMADVLARMKAWTPDPAVPQEPRPALSLAELVRSARPAAPEPATVDGPLPDSTTEMLAVACLADNGALVDRMFAPAEEAQAALVADVLGDAS